MPLIVPWFAETQTATIVIDGVTYRVPLLDADSRLYTTPRAVGASEVKSIAKLTVSNSSTRVPLLTPTNGKRIRIISATSATGTATGTNVEMYFGTGTTFFVDLTKGILFGRLASGIESQFAREWPDGGGPLGDVDEVVSMRTDVNISGSVVFMIHYREE